MSIYKIYCDESCHLQQCDSDVMVLGALICPNEDIEKVIKHIKYLKHKHGFTPELKWTKLNKFQIELYREIIDFILDNTKIRFKSIIIKNKKKLDHETYNGNSHDTFYYKMFYYTIRDFLTENNDYRIYLDYMNTRGGEKAKVLTDVLKNGTYNRINISTFIIRSHESILIQVCDLIIGALAYESRSDIEKTSQVKKDFISHLEMKLQRKINSPTSPWEPHFNIFAFEPR